jgi:hypothetical protein
VKYFFLILIGHFFNQGYTQNADTSFYSNKSILMITVKINQNDSVLAMYDLVGKNILSKNEVNHIFFDKKFGKKRTILVHQRKLIEDYCVLESDTVFNYFVHDETFDLRLQQFYHYLEQNVVYPKNALKKGVEALVKVSLVIDKNGSITQVYPHTKNEWGFEESLLRVIKDKKQFGFVLYKNRPINLYLEIPFAFKIQKR